MDLQTNQPNQETEQSSKKTKKIKESKKFKWWQSLLILLLTLVISVSAGYYVSAKYFWSNLDMNRINSQLKYYQDRVDKKPNDPNERVNLGYTYFLKGDNDEAIKQLKLAADLDKKNFNAYLNLSIVYNDEKRYNDALKAAQKAVELSPKDYKGQLQKGIVYRNLKMYKDSLDALNQANQLLPGNTDTIFEIGKVAEAQGHKKDAEKIYKEALSYDPMYKPALKALEQLTGKNK